MRQDKLIFNDRQAVLKAAECIGVSKKAMLIRLKQLRIAEPRPDSEYPGNFGN